MHREQNSARACGWGPRAALGLVLAAVATPTLADDHFETKVRPLLITKCHRCHGAQKQEGGLRLDAAGTLRGGDSGPAVVAGKPEDSLLVAAVRQTGDLKMPPEGRLSAQEVADLVLWIQGGANWPADLTPTETASEPGPQPLEPDAPSLAPYLQAWYRADRLPMVDGQPVHVWPDASGHGRDLSATSGVRVGGVGQPGRFVAGGTVHGRPAVRFDPTTGLASSPDRPVDIRGDAGLTIVVVMNLQPHEASPPYDGVVGIGNPAHSGNPGRPLAALLQIQRTGAAELQLAGGWTHDATLGPGSFVPLYNQPLVLTIVKQPGAMKSSTRFSINFQPVDPQNVGGVETVPDIQHRDDIGLYLGKALAWCGSIQGDVAEVIIYNTPLGDGDRIALETGLAERHGFVHPSVLGPSKVTFTPEQKGYWAFQPVKAVTPPKVQNEAWAQSPVDRFVLKQLEAAGLSPARPADKRTLIRRATFDLTGLPPTPAEIDRFVNDDRPEAYADLVDRLLETPHYGERWARHWLDVVRYAETTANDANAVMRYAWRYRDYVVQALNQDKPYDQFIVEQLAGDLLPPASDPRQTAEHIVASGFLMLGPKALAETDKEQSRLDIVDDQIDTTGRAFLGLTIACARCHNHKFDPIPTVDYYSLAGIFRGAEVFRDENRNATMWQEYPVPQSAGEPPLVVMAPRDSAARMLRVALRGNRFTPGIPAPRRFLQVLAGEGHSPLTTPQSGRLELARWIASRDNPLTARVIVNRVWQHHFGIGLVATSDNFGVRGEAPSHPELLDWLAAGFVDTGWSLKSLHRRLVLSATYQMSSESNPAAFAKDPSNRLLWRMPVRRLDAESLRDAVLAVSGQLDLTVGGDESGELLFREGEVIDKNRDSIRPNRVSTDHAVYATSRRRSLYLPVVRNSVPDVMALFDGADPNGVTAVRNETTVASQALFLLNHPFVREQSRHFAVRALSDARLPIVERVSSAFRQAVGRQPQTAEIDQTLQFLSQFEALAGSQGQSAADAQLAAWQSFCQSLLCRNEFIYID